MWFTLLIFVNIITMKRTKGKVENTGMVRYRKLGGGSLRFRGRIIKPNQVFEAYPGDIPPAFSDVIVPVDKDSGKPVRSKIKPAEYKLKARDSGGWFDIVNAKTGKRMNDKALKRSDALKLIEKLAG